PAPRLEPPLDVKLLALGQVLLTDLGRFAPHDDTVPFGPLLLLTVLVRPRFVGGEADVAHRLPAGRVAKLGVGPEVADENDLVDTACRHVCSLRSKRYHARLTRHLRIARTTPI